MALSAKQALEESRRYRDARREALREDADTRITTQKAREYVDARRIRLDKRRAVNRAEADAKREKEAPEKAALVDTVKGLFLKGYTIPQAAKEAGVDIAKVERIARRYQQFYLAGEVYPNG